VSVKSEHSTRLLVRASLLELWRRQDLWVLMMLMGMYALIALGARATGEMEPQTATFMLNLGLTLSAIFSQLLTLLIAVRQIPVEMEQRTLYPLLAKPLTRDALLLGKWLAAGLCGVLSALMFQGLVFLVTPVMEPFHASTLLQHQLLLPLSLFAVAGMGIHLSLWLPKGLALCSGALLVFAAEPLVRAFQGSLPPVLLLPRFGALNLVTRYTDGIAALAAPQFILMAGYILLWNVLWTVLSRERFRRMPL